MSKSLLLFRLRKNVGTLRLNLICFFVLIDKIKMVALRALPILMFISRDLRIMFVEKKSI